VGLPLGETKRALRDADLKVGDVTREFNERFDADQVIRQSVRADAEAPLGSEIDLVVSKGPTPVPLEKVTGLQQDEATAVLEAQGFVVDVQQEFSDQIEKGTVISQTPANTDLQPGRMTIVVSKRPEFLMPNVVGMGRMRRSPVQASACVDVASCWTRRLRPLQAGLVPPCTRLPRPHLRGVVGAHLERAPTVIRSPGAGRGRPGLHLEPRACRSGWRPPGVRCQRRGGDRAAIRPRAVPREHRIAELSSSQVHRALPALVAACGVLGRRFVVHSGSAEAECRRARSIRDRGQPRSPRPDETGIAGDSGGTQRRDADLGRREPWFERCGRRAARFVSTRATCSRLATR
jgi:hypothetical protein